MHNETGNAFARRDSQHETVPRGVMERNMRTAVRVAMLVACLTPVGWANDIKRPSPARPNPAVLPAEPDYRLGPEDVIDVFVWKEPELTTTIVIRPDGRISLPLTGEMEASGKTAVQLQQEISQKVRQYIAEPVVNVVVKQVNSMKISVLGEVRRPDVYKIGRRVSVLDAVAMAGGFTEFAKRKVVVLRKSSAGAQRIRFDVRHAVEDGNEQLYLLPQDTIYVE